MLSLDIDSDVVGTTGCLDLAGNVVAELFLESTAASTPLSKSGVLGEPNHL
jgi:hypothetical protein